MSLSRAERQRIDRIARGREEEPLHLLEGRKAVLDALPLGVVTEVVLRHDLADADRRDLLAGAAQAKARVLEGSAEDFERLGRTVTPQGVLAVVRDTAEPLEALLDRPGLLLWLDGLQDPGNVGAVVRVAAALGAGGLLVARGSADPLGLKALRASVGLALRVPFARATEESIAAAVRAKGRPTWLLDAAGDDLFRAGPAPRDLVLVIGGEGRGASPAARAAASRTLGIPLAPGVDSLNAAVAAGIAVALLTRRS